jgi:hypothetical protein
MKIANIFQIQSQIPKASEYQGTGLDWSQFMKKVESKI